MCAGLLLTCAACASSSRCLALLCASCCDCRLWLLFAVALFLLSLVIHHVCCLALSSGSAALILVMPHSQYQFHFGCLNLNKTTVMLANPWVLDPQWVTVTPQENLQPVCMVYTCNRRRYNVMGHGYGFGKPYPRVTRDKPYGYRPTIIVYILWCSAVLNFNLVIEIYFFLFLNQALSPPEFPGCILRGL